jgi:flavin-dependent dehydrogenase
MDYDVIIIGGGPAGSVAGINLARAGLNTAIIERKLFPRETLCGEFLSVEVTEHLKELELFEKFISLNPNKISSFEFITSNNKRFNTLLPFTGYSLKRSIFDSFLLNEAEKAGAKIFQPASLQTVKREKKTFLSVIKTETGSESFTSRFVIGAYGKSNILDKKLNRIFPEYQSGYNGIKFHLRKSQIPNIDDTCINIFSGNGIYCGINTVSRDEVTVCFLEKKNKSDESPKEHFKKFFNDNKNFAALFGDVTGPDINEQQIYGAGNIYFGKKELTRDGIIMIGDAARVIAPLAGDGIGMAFQSAKIASKIIAQYFNEKKGNMIEENYNRDWNKQFYRRIKSAGIIQNLMLKGYIEKIPVSVTRVLIPLSIKATRN